jgi:DNA-binding FadR family transcriptional regulator
MGTRLISDHAADQAERKIAEWILIGKYRAGEQLPSAEALMEELGVAYPTVSKAVGRLRAKRLVRFEPGVGVIVQSLFEYAALEMLCPMLTHCDEPWRRWAMLCQFYDFIRPVLVECTERAALNGTKEELDWVYQYAVALEDRHNRKSTRADIGQTEYELARVLASAAGNFCFTMTLNPLAELYMSDFLAQGVETVVPVDVYMSMFAALQQRNGKEAGRLIEAALWKRQSECMLELKKLGWSARGDRLDFEVSEEPSAA